MGEAINTADAVAKDAGKPVVFGNPDNWVLLTKFVSSDKSIAKSTKAWEIGGVGVVLQVSTKEGGSVAEALTFVPGVKIGTDGGGNPQLYPACA